LPGDKVTDVQTWETNGDITAFGGLGMLQYEFDAGNNETVVTAVNPDINKDGEVDLLDFAILANCWLQ